MLRLQKQTKNKERKNSKMIEVTLTNAQKVIGRINPTSGSGKPAPVDGPPTWEIVAGTGTLTPAADGLSCECIPDDAFIGDMDVKPTADADLGSGFEPITDIMRLHVGAEKAESLGLSFDTPIPK
jgi:hypothetical protein